MRGDELSLLLGNPFWASVLVVVIVAVVLLIWDMARDGVFSKRPHEPHLVGRDDDRPWILYPEHRHPEWEAWKDEAAIQHARKELRQQIKLHRPNGDAA